MPLDSAVFDYEVQGALQIFSILPDIIDGMSGVWEGKDFASLEYIMNLNNIHNQQEVFNWLVIIINQARILYDEKRKSLEKQNPGRK